jgi:hypothetical protein
MVLSESFRPLAVLTAFAMSAPAADVTAKTVYLDMDVELDQVAPEDLKMYRVGGHDLDRIAYDDSRVDPVTHKAKITYLAHFIMGRWMPTTPTETSTLDLSALPYKLDFISAVNHGQPLLVVFEGATQRMAILARPDFHMLIAGKYTISATPLIGAAATEPPAHANDPSTMPMRSGMPPMPARGVEPQGAPGTRLSTNSTYGQLLDDPQSHAVLLKSIPEVVNNPQSKMGRDLPLKALSQFEPTLTADKLKEIDAGLAALPSK